MCTCMMSENKTNIRDDVRAESGMSTMDIVIASAIGLLVLVAVFQMAPMLGDSIDGATDLGYDVAASGTLDVTGTSSDGETVTIGIVVYEFDSDGSVTDWNAVVTIADTAAATAVTALTTAIGNNATTSAAMTATNPTATTVLLTSDKEGADGNGVATTETMANGAFGDTSLTGGLTDVSDWNDDDIPTGVDVWKENASLLLLVVLVGLLGLAILIIRGLQ